jgi:hypothetical protein
LAIKSESNPGKIIFQVAISSEVFIRDITSFYFQGITADKDLQIISNFLPIQAQYHTSKFVKSLILNFFDIPQMPLAGSASHSKNNIPQMPGRASVIKNNGNVIQSDSQISMPISGASSLSRTSSLPNTSRISRTQGRFVSLNENKNRTEPMDSEDDLYLSINVLSHKDEPFSISIPKNKFGKDLQVRSYFSFLIYLVQYSVHVS